MKFSNLGETILLTQAIFCYCETNLFITRAAFDYIINNNNRGGSWNKSGTQKRFCCSKEPGIVDSHKNAEDSRTLDGKSHRKLDKELNQLFF